MLIEFSVGNFRSFKDIVTLSMVAAKLTAKYKELDENNVFRVAGAPPLLTSAAVYGANASGKSNLIAAIAFMKTFVLDSPKETRPTGSVAVEPFRLSIESPSRPSHFEVVFVSGGRRYRYGFDATHERVTKEWLFTVPSSREARLFEREGDQVKLGEGFREGKELIARTRPNALLLSVAAQFNGPVAQRVLSWFRGLEIATGLDDAGIRFYTQRRFLEGDMRDDIVAFVRRLDLDIGDLWIEEATERARFPVGVHNGIRQLTEATLPAADAEVSDLAVRTVHRLPGSEAHEKKEVIFDLDEHESEGAKKLFALAGPVLQALQEGEVLVVDELDARLHPEMTRSIILLFNSRATNPKHAQLVFSTHDTNLLDNRLFRRDQIWFTEKDRQGATQLYSLVEFKVRNDASFQKDYIQGRYGAVPLLDDLREIVAVG